jgi:UDP-glucose 4-epimerase
MSVVVTGGCGFVGSHLVDVLLASGAEVTVVDDRSRGRREWADAPRRPHLVELSILDEAALEAVFREVRPATVYHLAADHYLPACEAAPRATFKLNVDGTLNVIEAARAAGTVTAFYFASTGDVYGRTPFPNMEAEPANPSTIYGESKLLAELLLRRYWTNAGLPFAITVGRMFNAVGTGETSPHLVPSVVARAMSGTSTVQVGNLWPVRDFVDVTSMAEAIKALTETGRGFDVVNIGSGAPLTVRDALDILLAAAPMPLNLVSTPSEQRPDDRPFLAPEVGRLRGRLGWVCEPFGSATARAIWREDPARNG